LIDAVEPALFSDYQQGTMERRLSFVHMVKFDGVAAVPLRTHDRSAAKVGSSFQWEQFANLRDWPNSGHRGAY
jgi:hypothetical protein